MGDAINGLYGKVDIPLIAKRKTKKIDYWFLCPPLGSITGSEFDGLTICCK